MVFNYSEDFHSKFEKETLKVTPVDSALMLDYQELAR